MFMLAATECLMKQQQLEYRQRNMLQRRRELVAHILRASP
jgi:hypothetical protein